MENLKHLFTSILFLLCSTVATAHEFEVNGIFYNITDETNKTVAVTYKGDSYYNYSDEYTGSVVIPENVTYNGNTYSVTSIGGFAFFGCTGLRSVTIGNSVTSIGGSAFYDCSGLTSVTIPNSVTSIGEGAFYNTGWYNNQPDGILKLSKWVIGYKGTAPSGELNINKKEIGIADGAFKNCSDLTAVSIGNNITSIGYYAFRGCTGLTSITIGNSVTSIGYYAFYDCTGLTSVTIGNSVTSIGERAFSVCTGLTSITIPNSVTSIGESAFNGCSGLTSITIPNSVTSIGHYAFRGTAWYNSQPNGCVYVGKCFMSTKVQCLQIPLSL